MVLQLLLCSTFECKYYFSYREYDINKVTFQEKFTIQHVCMQVLLFFFIIQVSHITYSIYRTSLFFY